MRVCIINLIVTIFNITLVLCDTSVECERPSDLKLKEEYCWATEVEIVDRVVQTSKNILNFAKRKLGMPVENENEIKKCEYYMCILRQLHLLNANEYPSYENINQWAEKHVIYFQEIELMKQLNKCHNALTNCTVREANFYADQVDNDEQHEVKRETNEEQTTCEIAAEFVNCLSKQKCPVFQFP